MRSVLRAAVFLAVLLSATVLSIDFAQAAGKPKGKAEAAAKQAAPAVNKGKAPASRQAGAAEPAARKSLAKTGSAKPAPSAGKPQTTAARNAARQLAAPTSRTSSRHASQLAAAPAKAPSRSLAQAAKKVQPGPASHRLALAEPKKSVRHALASPPDLWQEPGQLAVHSGSALVVEQDSSEALYEKNSQAVLPIASITKVMTAMVVLDSMPSLQAPITITEEDVDYLRGSRSRLHVGTVLTRETALLLALMSSENRAANALGRNYPGGLAAFVAAMNRKAAALGMSSTRFEDPTGLSSNNVSTARDLARMVAAAHRYPLIREFSTTTGARADVNGREIEFHNTNQLVSSPTWEIGLSKTGYIQEAGKCLVMQARVAEKPVVIVLLDAAGKQTRIGDANRIKRWMESASASGRSPTRV